MGVLNYQISTTGLIPNTPTTGGQALPTIIYLQTNDTLATVVTTGYLNESKHAFQIPYNNYQMALVYTVDQGDVWLKVVVSGANYSLLTPSEPGIVTSVLGTTNRITSSGGANPVINISAAYAGQTSIVTVGALSTGSLASGFAVVTPPLGGTGVANTGTITVGGNTAFSGAYAFTGTLTGATTVTFPTTGTLATTSQVPNTSLVGGRLTLTTGTPVTTTDVTAATTLYFTPYKGENIDLYSGSAWVNFQQVQLSITNGGLSATTVYDVFMQYNSGTPQLSLTAWTNGTTRATALAYQNGVLVLSGTPTSRYLGTIYTDGSTKFNDALASRYVWNYYNRIEREMVVIAAPNDWAVPQSANFRQADASSTNQLNFVMGVVEDIVNASVSVTGYGSGGNATPTVGIGLNSTSVVSTSCINGYALVANDFGAQMTATFNGYAGLGLNYLAWLETDGNGGNLHMSADSAVATGNPYAGISGVILG